jgi:ABC-type phosphate transport system substrate-binding protein
MRKTTHIFAAAVIAALAMIAPRAAQAQDYKVVVNSANAIESISADEASKIFLKQATKFSNGTAAAPVDQKGGIKAAFAKGVHGKPIAAIETYWQQQIFSGKDVPPAAKGSDDEVIAFVKSNPGGIGYVSAGAATAGVKVISVK